MRHLEGWQATGEAGTDAPLGAAGTVEIALGGTIAVCDPMGALYLPQGRTLVLSDLHLEKGAAFARRGMMLPPYDTPATLALMARAIERYRPRRIVSLGDSFHDGLGAAHLPEAFRAELVALMGGREWIWISGNHDPDAPCGLPGDAAEAVFLEGLTFRHMPSAAGTAANGEVAGHLHPAARVVRRGRSVRRACFATDGTRLVMPAFGVLAGGLDLRHPAISGLFDTTRLAAHILGRERIYTVAHARLSA